MLLQAYQFIKYDQNTTLEHITGSLKSDAVICFDFEDGIFDPLHPEMSVLLKEDARRHFNGLYKLLLSMQSNCKIGIRLNESRTDDFEKDLMVIEKKSFDSIFIPKTEHPRDLEIVIRKLQLHRVEYEKLIPVIETKSGLDQLENLVTSKIPVKLIAFGHSDYNLDIDSYPFFHQDSWQYWKWIFFIQSKIRKSGIKLINSPYLDVKNDHFFCSMMDFMAIEEGLFHGQITLSTRQSQLCRRRTISKTNFRTLLENKNLIAVNKQYAHKLISEFESNNKQKGLSRTNGKIISLHEYLASQKMFHDDRPVFNLLMVGGCFSVQHNILFEDLFHQKLKRMIEKNFHVKLNINIIRYERLLTVQEKIKNHINSHKTDLIIFHVRPEPYLRLVKFYYAYTDENGKKKFSFNIPFLKWLNPEKYDLLEMNRFHSQNKKPGNTPFRKFLITMNYLLGMLNGNKRYAAKKYLLTTNEVIDFCIDNNTQYLILGPNRRNNSISEPYLCKELNEFISTNIDNAVLVSGFEHSTSFPMNFENGIHVSQAYHDLMAERLYQRISPVLSH